MPAKGVQNTDEIIALCNETQSILGSSIEPQWKEVLDSVVEILEGMKAKFFLKTNPAVPVTNVIKKEAVALKETAESGEAGAFPGALERFRAAMEKLLKAAKMEGIIIT
jgi:hypothetical protein